MQQQTQLTEEILQRANLPPGQEYEVRLRNGFKLTPNLKPHPRRKNKPINHPLRVRSYQNALQKISSA